MMGGIDTVMSDKIVKKGDKWNLGESWF